VSAAADPLAEAIADRVVERVLARLPALPPERISYGVDEAAVVLGIGRTLLYDLIRRGVVDSTMIAGRRVIPVEELRRLAREGAA